MPRPKRTRPVASRKATEEPTPAQPSAPLAQASAHASSDIYDLSDREKERLARRKSGVDVDTEQIEGKARQPPPVAVEAIPQDVTVGASSGDFESPPELGRRSETSARRARHTDVSGLELDDSMFGDLDDSLVAGEDSQAGQHSTVNETSSLNVAAFRRRPRVSSIVGKDDAPIRPSSRGPNTPGITSTFSFGNFKRRKREPSILGTRHRSVSRQPGVSGDESGGDGDFTRLGDATPARRAVSRSSAVRSRAASAEPLQQRQTRKRKSLEDQGGGGKRVAAESSTDVHNSIEVDDDDDGPLSSPPTTPARAATPDPDDPDLAPPASIASSEDSPVIKANKEIFAPRHHRAMRSRSASRARKTPELDADASDISSPPSLTHSPNYSAPPPRRAAQRGRARKHDPSPTVATTAELASLLPRRRHQHVEVGSDADEEDTLTPDNDDDELSYAQPRGRSKRRVRPLGNASNVAAAKGKQPAKGKGGKRTYGSRVSDKENVKDSIVVGASEDEATAGEEEEAALDAETSQMMLERLGEELKSAAKKFKEVDKWELEFEEVTEPSSPGPGAAAR